MKQVKIKSDHPIIFIYDATNAELLIPEYIDGCLTAHNSNCVSVGIQDQIAGPTTVMLMEIVAQPEGQLVFEGTIRTPSRTVSVSTSETESLIAMPVPHESVNLRIWANDGSEPSIILIEAH